MLVIYEAVEGMTKTAKGTIRLPYDHLSAYDAVLETMSLREMGPQLKLPINVTKGSMPLQCCTYFPQIFAI